MRAALKGTHPAATVEGEHRAVGLAVDPRPVERGTDYQPTGPESEQAVRDDRQFSAVN